MTPRNILDITDRNEFRNWLMYNSAKEYERLKLSLLPGYKHDRDGYTDAKAEFVRNIVGLARNC